MDFSYADYIIHKHSLFLDPFSMNEISTEMLCYPVFYANEDIIKGLDCLSKGKDTEDDILIRQSALKDFPTFEKLTGFDVCITDGAAHIWKNHAKEPVVQLLGMPRIGKTSLLKKLALMFAISLKNDESAPVPLLVNSEIFMQGTISCKMELIETCFSQFEEFEAYLREKFFAGKLVLILDEADRLGTMGAKVADWLLALKLIVNIPLCVISSRISGYIPLESVPVLMMDVYPMKLQISLGQSMLSELQFERFIEKVTVNSSFFSEFASTPYLLSLLLEMFRWGIVGIEEKTSRGKLYYSAIKHLLNDFDQCKYWHGLELLAADMLLRDTKIFNMIDIKNLDLEDVWCDIKDLGLFLQHEEQRKASTESEQADSDSFKDEGIGEIRETPIVSLLKDENQDVTPKWVSNSKDNYLTYQIARSCIEQDIFNSFYSEGFRFVHLRFLEILTAYYYLNQVEDSLLHITSGFLMESSAFNKAFNSCFPVNFLFSRRYREVLLFFSSICSENIFENLIKFLLHKNTAEHLYVTEILLRERGHHPNHRPLLNKFKQDKQDICKKNYVKGFAHPSAAVRRICRQEAMDSGLSDAEMFSIVHKSIDSILKNTHWLYLKQMTHFTRETNIKIVKSVFLRLFEVTSQIINNGTRPATSKTILHRVLLLMFIAAFDKSELNSLNHSFSQSFVASASQDDPKASEEATIRISFDQLKIPRNEISLIEKVGNCQKLIVALEEIVNSSPGVDVGLCVRLLLILGCSVSRIHTAIACRFEAINDKYEKLQILKTLRLLGFVTQHTIDIPLICIKASKDLKSLSVDIIKLLNSEKLKNHAISVLMKDDSSSFKLILALRALKYTNRVDLNEDVMYLLVQFIDHYALDLRFEAISSLYYLLKPGLTIDQQAIRKILAATPHVLRDRLRLLKYDVCLRIASLKCIAALWISLDKGKTDSNASDMPHILVQEHISTSFIVGSPSVVIAILKDFLTKSLRERETVWKALYLMSPIFDIIDSVDTDIFVNEIKEALLQNQGRECEYILKMLIISGLPKIFHQEIALLTLNLDFERSEKTAALVNELLVTWGQVHLIKSLVASSIQISPDLGLVLTKTNMMLTSGKLPEAEGRYLTNWYKSLINQLAENLQWPSKMYPHCNQLLDISADPSFFQNESLPDITFCLDPDSSLPKVSMDSANSDQEESPPPVDILYQLVLAGVRSEGLRYWVLWYLKNSGSILELSRCSVAYNILSDNKEFYNPQVESNLSKLLNEYPEDVVCIVEKLRFKSDSFSLRIIDSIIKGKLKTEIACSALVACIEMHNSIVIEELYKMMWVTVGDTSHLVFMNNCVSKVMKNIVINNDTQLNSVSKALATTGCSLLVQPIWDYVINMIRQRPNYLVPVYTLGVFESCSQWDCKFLLSRFKIMGLLPVDVYQKESGSSMSTRKI